MCSPCHYTAVWFHRNSATLNIKRTALWFAQLIGTLWCGITLLTRVTRYVYWVSDLWNIVTRELCHVQFRACWKKNGTYQLGKLYSNLTHTFSTHFTICISRWYLCFSQDTIQIFYYGSTNSTNRLLHCKTVTRQAMHVHNTEARSSNLCCSGKEIGITYSGCLSIYVDIQNAMRVRRITPSSVACPAL